ncbi:MAG: helix-turn-helix transcriptional regulator [Halolamina sp.]
MLAPTMLARSPLSSALVVTLALVLGTVAAPVAADAAVASETPTAQPETDNTVTRIQVHRNGSARWSVSIRTRLETDQQVAEYERFQSRFRNNTSDYLGPFRDRISSVVAGAADATGREMNATGFAATTRIQELPRRWGVVTYSFRWSNFAVQQERSLVVGDVFEGGLFIAANDTLVVQSPAGYTITAVDPEPDSRDSDVVGWNGQESFDDGRPRVVFSPATTAESTGSARTGTAGSAGSDQSSPTERAAPALLPGLGRALSAVVLVAAVALLALQWRRSSDGADEPDGAGDGSVGAGGSAAGVSGADDAAVLTDEERVVQFLDENGGRVRQAAVADAFDWSDSKTSRVLGGMADEGTVSKVRIGRENLVSLEEGQ